MRRSLSDLCLCLSAMLLVASVVLPSRAGDAPKALSCQVAGKTTVAGDALIYDRGSDGKPIAKLPGARLPLTVTHIPNPSPPKGRVGVSTTLGSKAVRIDGWLDKEAIRFFAARDLPLVGDNLWITKGQALTITGATQNEIHVSHRVLGSSEPALTAKIPCDGASLSMVAPEAIDAPARARTYQMRHNTLALYDGPRGALVYTLTLDENTRKVFWSTEQRGAFVRVMSRADITIDAWAKAADLSYLHHAELFDLAAVAPKPFPERKLEIQDPPKVVVVERDMPIHAKPENAPTPIGWLEAGARIYPMEQSGDWTNILPESLAVLPPDNGGFWVRTAGLPKP